MCDAKKNLKTVCERGAGAGFAVGQSAIATNCEL
jgi:hypothetical protein